MDRKRPGGRDTHVTNNSMGVHKRGEGLGTGPVGSSGGYGRPGSGSRPSGSQGGGSGIGSGSSQSGRSGGGSSKAIGGGGIGLAAIIGAIVLVVKMCGGHGAQTTPVQDSYYETTESTSSSSILEGITGLFGGGSGSSSASSLSLPCSARSV